MLQKRLNSFENDIKHWDDYDYVIVNDNLDNCFRQVEKIISLNSIDIKKKLKV